jgi:hypothetical protein
VGWVDFELQGSFLSWLADELVGGEAFEGFEFFCEVVDHPEALHVFFERLMP